MDMALTVDRAASSNMLKGSAINFIGLAFRQTTALLYALILAHWLSADEVGLYFLALTIMNFSSIIGLLGLDVGVKRFVSIHQGERNSAAMENSFQTAALFVFPLSAIIVVFFFLFGDSIATIFFSKDDLGPVLRLISPFLLLFTVSELYFSFTHGMKIMNYRVLGMDIFGNVGKILITFILFAFGIYLNGALIGTLTAMGLVAVYAVYSKRKALPPDMKKRTEPRQYKSILSFSVPVLFSRMASNMGGMFETILLGTLVASEYVGIYSVALRVSLVGMGIMSSFNVMFAPIISELHYQSRMKKLESHFKDLTKCMLVFSVPIFMFTIAFAPEILLLFGENYGGGAESLIILCVGQLMSTLAGPSGMMLLMSGYRFLNLFNNALGMMLIIVGCYLIVPTYGIVGCALASTVSLTACNALRLYFVRKMLGMHPYTKFSLYPTVAGAVIAGITKWIFYSPSAEAGLLKLAMAFCTLCLLYALSILPMLRMDDSMRRFIVGTLEKSSAKKPRYI